MAHSFRVSVALTSPPNGWDGQTSFIVNTIPFVNVSLNTTSQTLNYTTMLKPSTLQLTLDELISSQEDSPVNHSVRQGLEKEPKTNATCGPACCESFERFPQSTSWAKTFAGYLIGQGAWYSKRCALTWKLRATKSHRIFFQLAAKTHPTEGIESGLLLTPTTVMTDEHPDKMRARVSKNGYKNGTKFGSLLSQVKYSKMLPTPIAGDWKGQKRKDGTASMLSGKASLGMLPTPVASDHNAGRRGNAPREGSNPMTNSLKDAMNFKEKTSKCSQLNPLFVEEMMGFPKNWTVLPFQSGEKNPSKPTETQ